MIPMSENFFTGRDDVWFCPHMKESLGSAASLMAHVEKDELIQEGFKGTRGLNEEFGIPKAVEVRKQPYQPEPPGSMTYQQFKQRAKAWIDAMGGKFREPKECGCVPQKYKAKIGQRWDVKSNMGVIQSQLESEANFLMDVTFDTEGSFTGHMTVPREFAVHQTGLGTSCEGKGSWYQTWSISGIVNDNSGDMLIKLRFASSPQQGQMTCYTPAGPVTKPFSRPGFSSDSVSTPLAGFVMPAKVGAKQHFEWSLLGGRNTVDIELTKVTS
jgi:hypothetical protein